MYKVFAVEQEAGDLDLDAPQWRVARERLRLYVTALQLPEAEARRLLDAALAQARAADPVMPLPAAMAALSTQPELRASGPASMPAPSRRGMRPERIERSALRLLVSGLLRPLASGTLRLAHAQRHRFLLIFFTAAAGLLLPRIG